MKKILSMIFLSLCLFGCGDSEYIDRVKNIDFKDEKILYASNIEILARNLFTLMQMGAPLSEQDIKWKISKTNRNSKIIEAEYLGNKIYFYTEDDGKAIELDFSRSYTRSKYGIEASVAQVIKYDNNDYMKKMLDY